MDTKMDTTSSSLGGKPPRPPNIIRILENIPYRIPTLGKRRAQNFCSLKNQTIAITMPAAPLNGPKLVGHMGDDGS